jgi:acetyltransferase-like isoleucine patch superfamily enzyme
MFKVLKSYFKNQLKAGINWYIDKHLSPYIKEYISQKYLHEQIKNVVLNQYLVFGDPNRLQLSKTCVVNNALFNLSSGNIYIGEYVFFGHNVSLITGSHDYHKFGKERMVGFPKEGNDIIVEEGAWIASNVTVLGPCKIGKHSVVAAGAVVKNDVPSYHVVAGVPAKTVKKIESNK